MPRQRDGFMPEAGKPAQRGPAPAADCLHWRGANDRRSSLLASASAPHQLVALSSAAGVLRKRGVLMPVVGGELVGFAVERSDL